jgi:hypothetical protein
MHEIYYSERTIDNNTAKNCSLSIQVNPNGLTYCVIDGLANSFVHFKHFMFEHVHLAGDLVRMIDEAFSRDVILGMQFQSVRFMLYTQQTTLVPDAFFDIIKMPDYLKFNHAGDIDSEIFDNLIRNDIHNVFALPVEIVAMVKKQFTGVEFMNQSTPFLRHIFNLPSFETKSAVYVCLNPAFFDIACIGEGKLKLYNTFQYGNESDLLYYIVFVCQQLGIDTRIIPLYLAGEMSSKLIFYEILKEYFPGTRYDELAGVPALAPGLRQVSSTRFFNLLNMQLCELSEEHTAAEK